MLCHHRSPPRRDPRQWPRLRRLHTPLMQLLRAPESLNPALHAAWLLKQEEQRFGGYVPLERLIEIDELLETAERDGTAMIAASQQTLRLLLAAPAQPARQLPEGF